jgi:hypothetical protein
MNGAPDAWVGFMYGPPVHPTIRLLLRRGTIQNKEQRVAPIRSGKLKYDYAKYDEINVRIYGEMAIVTAHVTVKSE